MSEFITPDQVCERVPGLTKGHLAQLRFTGKGPRFYKPTPRTVFYKLEEVLEWIEQAARTSTAEIGA
ncbi:helix-turn-helix transcriptional regulator [Leucobacter chromiiresistens]|uniref:Uncharacterized protein n=1 Tax=Leucobacter chromiiresistens TaxID=1079994 RepID=A0A1H0Y8M7_9MICO|nr:hypothetical protein [Leucobacter chromiiresistens]SDQ11453.1 hypothetical protein SAMN04488565_0627 [Leucobacter chromiiresistens]